MLNFFKVIVIGVLLFVSLNSFAQNKTYVVYLKTKSALPFNPYQYFDAKNIERKLLANLPLFDERDLPLNNEFVNQIKTEKVNTLVESRWLNALFLQTNSAEIERITKLPFVKHVDEYISPTYKYISAEKELDFNKLNLLNYQTERLQASQFTQNNLTGKGIRIAVFDVGFSGTDKHKAFAHLRKNNQIKLTYDFISKNENVYHSGSHGTNTLSCIAGIYNNIKMGMARDADFLLARTEWNIKENKQEEYFWLAAAEWADKNGVNKISSSLGYGGNWYKVKDMDGKKSVVAFAATVAAQKGILVINSAGNEYQDEAWKTIITPSDADSVLCIGGTDPYTDRQISFSSIGPSADGRLKPNVSAPGQVIAAYPNGSFGKISGTSFSCPLVAGFAACAWQNNRSLSNMQLFKEIEKSGHLYPYYDYTHGYGVPQASYFTTPNKAAILPTFNILDSTNENKITFQIIDSAIIKDYTIIENFNDNLPPNEWDEFRKTKNLNLYYHIKNNQGNILNYKVIEINEKEPFEIEDDYLIKGNTITLHFEGYTFTKTIK